MKHVGDAVIQHAPVVQFMIQWISLLTIQW